MITRSSIKRNWNDALDIADFIRAKSTLLIAPNYVRKEWEGTQKLEGARKVVVFNHFDVKGIVHEYVEYYLKSLAAAGFVIVFASNSPEFPQTSVEKLKPLTARILWRSNVGYDFGAFKDGISRIPDLGALDLLLITNDSMYGPLQHLPNLLKKADPAKADLWGVTDCWDQRFHLQSYFLLCHPKLLRSNAFQQFWRNLPYYRRKTLVVRHGEIGLTRFFQRHGFRCQAFFPYRDVVATLAPQIEAYLAGANATTDPVRYRYLDMVARCLRDGVPLNQTHFFWDHLLGAAGCPFIKRDLLQRNPMAIPFLHHWEALLRQSSTYDSRLIIQHLQQTMQNRVY